ncbi:MAG TPA: ABC transporter substrate-binding protein [Actinotalea caeni]|uniref:ABC transporter substrate-binding protein n=1 Tax=Actinotalea caeni TaxID=1348467 RepID=UPI002B4AFB2C|nr:ABC transporter substrate-binding protein [Actinotalea caeni]HLV55761.1 ABC transporter substrate-binding protein [Actinotalea caeni]
MRLTRVLAAASLLLVATACSTSDGDAGGGPSTDGAATCEPGALPTLTDGTLTVGTSVPYEPWYVGEDPTSGEGFESALVYAVAAELGYEHDDVAWEQVTFEQIVSPSEKPFDLAAYQTSITPEREQAVDFSSPYLTTRQGVVVAGDGDLADAASLADLEGARIGVTASQTSLTVAEAAWGDAVELVPYDDAGLAMQALSNDQVQAVVMDVDQAVAATTVYFPGTQVIGTLPDGGVVEQLGFVLDLDSPLTDCVSAAVDALEQDGTLAELRTEWLRSDDIPELG